MIEQQTNPQVSTGNPCMVPQKVFNDIINSIKPWRSVNTEINWVNWRKDEYQIKVEWSGRATLVCYLNFFSQSERDAVHAAIFEKHARAGEKPYLQQGHGWAKYRHDMVSDKLITINELSAIANEMDIKHTVIYAQENISARPLFDDMGIPLVAGEMGKELIDGVMQPYSREAGKCL